MSEQASRSLRARLLSASSLLSLSLPATSFRSLRARRSISSSSQRRTGWAPHESSSGIKTFSVESLQLPPTSEGCRARRLENGEARREGRQSSAPQIPPCSSNSSPLRRSLSSSFRPASLVTGGRRGIERARWAHFARLPPTILPETPAVSSSSAAEKPAQPKKSSPARHDAGLDPNPKKRRKSPSLPPLPLPPPPAGFGVALQRTVPVIPPLRRPPGRHHRQNVSFGLRPRPRRPRRARRHSESFPGFSQLAGGLDRGARRETGAQARRRHGDCRRDGQRRREEAGPDQRLDRRKSVQPGGAKVFFC